MKRALLRISVLAIIVALGLIAIAQAQRSIGKSSQAADPSTVPQARTSTAEAPAPPPAESPAPPPAFSAENRMSEPRGLPEGMRANPLRSGNQRGFSEAVTTTALSADASTSDRPSTDSLPVHPTNQSAASHMTDPFAIPPPMAVPTAATSAAPSSTPLGSTGPSLPGSQSPLGPTPVGNATPPDASSAGLAPAAPPVSPPAGLSLPSDPPTNSTAAAPTNTSPRAATTIPDNRVTQGSSQEPGRLPVEPFASRDTTAVPSTPGGELPKPATSEPLSVAQASRQATPIAAGSSATAIGQGTGTPGETQLEGPQSPQLTIQKTAPSDVQVGKPAKFQVKVRNTGAVAAQNVEIHDEVPRGAQLVNTTPNASRGVRGDLVWSAGVLKPGEEASVEMEVMPVAEGEMGSVATVTFNAAASAKCVATKPELAIKTTAPRQVLIGEEITLSITISNPGSGAANGVVLEERVPAGLQHAAGAELEYDIGVLKPNESRQLELHLVATQPGPITNVLTARGGGNLHVEDRVQLEVLAPKLEVALDGPKRRYLEREAVYTVMVSNPGTAPARQVELVAQLPAGMKFVNANNSGSYDQATQTVRWLLEELPANEKGAVQLTALPVVAGEQTIRIKGIAQRGLQSEKEHSILVEGIAAILFEVADVADPIEVNGETTYEIRVVNQGSKAATNVRVTAELPPGMRPIAAEGQTRYAANGNTVSFEALSRLAPKADTTYRIRAQGIQPGDHRIRVQLQTDELQKPVMKEESTRVYSDG